MEVSHGNGKKRGSYVKLTHHQRLKWLDAVNLTQAHGIAATHDADFSV